MTNNHKTAIIGDNFLTELLISTSYKHFQSNTANFYVYGKDEQHLNSIRENYGVHLVKDLNDLSKVNAVVLTLETKDATKILQEIKNFVQKDTLIVSFVYNFQISELTKYFPVQSIIRVVFTPIVISGSGIFSYFVGKVNSVDAESVAQLFFSNFGKIIKVNSEKELETIGEILVSETVASYLEINALIEGGMKAGLSQEVSREIATGIFSGIARTLTESDPVIDYLIAKASEEKNLEEKLNAAKKIIEEYEMWNFAKDEKESAKKKLLKFHYHWQ